MKKLFKKLLAVALIGAMVGFVGCKDYDDDIDALNNRIDGIENGQIKTINEQIATMQSSISSLQSAQTATQNAVSALQATVATLETKADHAADVAALENKIAEAKTALEAAVAAAKAEHAADKAALEAAIAALEAAHEADVKAVMAEIAALQAADADLKAQIAANEESIAALEAEAKELDATIAKIEESMKEMATMTWVEATLEAYATSEYVAEELGELWATLTPATMRIADLESQMTENWAADEKQQEAIEAAQEALAALEAELEETKKWVEEYVQVSVADAGMKLWAKYLEHLSAWVYPDIDALYLKTAETEKALADAYAALEKAIAEGDQAVKAALSSEIDNLQNERAKLEIALKAADEELQKQIDALKGQVAALQALVGEISVADAIAQAIEENNGVLAEEFIKAMEPIKKAIKDLQADVEEIEKQLLATKINVSALMDRIQSLVYVPEYDDHKASFPVLTVANDNGAEIVAEGKIAMTFQVTPASAAKKLVALGKDVFHYELKEVKTRAAGFGLEIEDVVLGKEHGQFVVIAQTKNTAELVPDMIVEYTEVDYTYVKYTLKPTPQGHNETVQKPGRPGHRPTYEEVFVTDYYTYELVEETVTETITIPTVTYKAKKSYSVALHVEAATNEEAVEATKSDVVSHYVNLLPYVETLQGIEVGFEKDGKVVTMSQVDYEINWDDVTTKIHLLDGFAPYLVINEKQIALADAQKIYNLPELKKIDNNKVFNKAGEAQDPHNFMINHGELYECDEVVSLVKAEKKWLGDYVETTHTYYFGEDDAPLCEGDITTKVTIVKPTVTLQLAPVTYYWWYQDYSTFFAAEQQYEGTEFAGTTFKSYVTAGVLPEDITPAEIAGGQHVAYLKGEDGKYNSSAVRVRISASGEDEDGVYFSLGIKNWAFNKDYSVKVTKELEAIDVNFVFDASFVGLPEKVEYAYAEAVMPYKAADNAFVTTVAEADKGKALAAIYEAVGADAEAKKYFAKVDEFVNLVTALKGATPLTAVKLVATRVSGGDEETATNVTDATKGFVSPEYIANTALLSPRHSSDLFDAYYQVLSSDVVTDADAFEFKTSVITEPGLVIELTGAASIEMPAYRVRHSQTWVAEPTEENDFFHSYVKGLWTPEMKKDVKLTDFSTSEIELQSAFILQEYKDGLWKDLTAMPTGVKFTYAITDKTYDKPGIEIVDNKLKYNGATESVNVLGKLYVNNVEITSAFKYDETDYTTYRVFKYDPLEDVKEIHTEDQDINTSAGKESYEFNIWKNLSILDKRGAEIVNQSAKTLDKMWNSDNASFGKSAAELFGIKLPIEIGEPLCLYAGTNDEADGLEGRIQIVDGVITFTNLNNLAVQKNIEVRVPVKVTYYWGVKEGYVVYNILK